MKRFFEFLFSLLILSSVLTEVALDNYWGRDTKFVELEEVLFESDECKDEDPLAPDLGEGISGGDWEFSTRSTDSGDINFGAPLLFFTDLLQLSELACVAAAHSGQYLLCTFFPPRLFLLTGSYRGYFPFFS